MSITMHDARRTFDIEDDVPLPEGTPQESRTIYPLGQMQPGQSFFVPSDKTLPMKVLQNRIKAAIGGAQRRTPGTSFTWRISTEITKEEIARAELENRDPQKSPGVRVWRQV